MSLLQTIDNFLGKNAQHKFSILSSSKVERSQRKQATMYTEEVSRVWRFMWFLVVYKVNVFERPATAAEENDGRVQATWRFNIIWRTKMIGLKTQKLFYHERDPNARVKVILYKLSFAWLPYEVSDDLCHDERLILHQQRRFAMRGRDADITRYFVRGVSPGTVSGESTLVHRRLPEDSVREETDPRVPVARASKIRFMIEMIRTAAYVSRGVTVIVLRRTRYVVRRVVRRAFRKVFCINCRRQ